MLGFTKSNSALPPQICGATRIFNAEFIRHSTGHLVLHTTREDVAKYYRNSLDFEVRDQEPEDFTPRRFLQVKSPFLPRMMSALDNLYWIVELQDYMERRKVAPEAMANLEMRIQNLKAKGVKFPTLEDLREEQIRRNSPLQKPESVLSAPGGVEGWKVLQLPEGLEASVKPIELRGNYGLDAFFGVRVGDLPKEFTESDNWFLAFDGNAPPVIFYASQLAKEYMSRQKEKRDAIVRAAAEKAEAEEKLRKAREEAEASGATSTPDGSNPTEKPKTDKESDEGEGGGETGAQSAETDPANPEDGNGGKTQESGGEGEKKGNGEDGDPNTPPTPEEIREKLEELDPDDDTHWVENGFPRMTAIEARVKNANITRADVEAAYPGFNREMARQAQQDL